MNDYLIEMIGCHMYWKWVLRWGDQQHGSPETKAVTQFSFCSSLLQLAMQRTHRVSHHHSPPIRRAGQKPLWWYIRAALDRVCRTTGASVK